MDVLPDSRAHHSRDAIFIAGHGWFEWVHCANCGKRYGLVPEAHITHVFALCDQGCAGKYGDMAHTYVDPDAVYRERASDAALKKYGRPLTPGEVERELSDPSSIFSVSR